MSCSVGRNRSLDLELLWLWHRLAATALSRPLGWEPPYATGTALKKKKDKRQKKKKKKKKKGKKKQEKEKKNKKTKSQK